MIGTDLLHELFEYKEGLLIRKVDRGSRGRKGDVVGCLDNSTGYLVTGINGKFYYVHRLIWQMHNDEIPNVIDHINHNKLDNNIDNLRNVSAIENQQNRSGLDSDNTSGYRGVSWCKDRSKWEVYITVNKVRKQLGRFDNLKDAVAARAYAEELYFKK